MSQRGASKGQKRKRGETNIPLPSQETTTKLGGNSQVESKYGFWTKEEMTKLLQWLGVSSNYDIWKCVGIRNTEKKKTTYLSMPKKSVAGMISKYLGLHFMYKTADQILNKMCYIEDKYKDAKDFLNSTSEGLTTEDEKMQITSIEEKVKKLCPFFDTINPIMKDSVSIVPPYVGESRPFEDLSNMLFNNSTIRGDLESLEEEGSQPEGPEDEVEADADEEYEEDAAPTPATASTKRTTEAPHTTQLQANTIHQPVHRPPHHPRSIAATLTPNVRNVNKKPKSIGEQVADLQKESCLMLEKKLEVSFEHHKQKLDFQKDQLQKQFELDNWRLDLEFKKQENEKEELALQRLTLELELENLVEFEFYLLLLARI